MQSELLKIAEGFFLVAAALTEIANDSGSKETKTVESVPGTVKTREKAKAGEGSEPEKDSSPKIGIEDIRQCWRRNPRMENPRK